MEVTVTPCLHLISRLTTDRFHSKKQKKKKKQKRKEKKVTLIYDQPNPNLELLSYLSVFLKWFVVITNLLMVAICVDRKSVV